MSHTFYLKDRLPFNIATDKIKEILPEHYPTAYPNLVEFFDLYYQWMERDEYSDTQGFSYIIQGLYQLRDLSSTTLVNLDRIIAEYSFNNLGTSFFQNARDITKLISTFYRLKGSQLSAEGFFRALYNENVTVVYPKNNMFILNQAASKIGTNSLKYLQDDKRYQIHSILIQSGISLDRWQELFKLFVHPAGYYLAGDIIIEGVSDLNLGVMPDWIQDSAAGNVIFEMAAPLTISAPYEPLTLIVADDLDSDLYAERINPLRKLSTLASVTLSFFDDQYNSMIEYLDENGPRFDQDSDGVIVAVDFSNTLETMDQSNYDYWDSVNNTFQYLDSA